MPARGRHELEHVLRAHVRAQHARRPARGDETTHRLDERVHVIRLDAAAEALEERPVAPVDGRRLADELLESRPDVDRLGRLLGSSRQAARPLADDGLQQRVLRREPAEDGAVADAGAARDLVDAHVDAPLCEARSGRHQQAVEVALRVGAEFRHPIGTVAASASIASTSRRRSSETYATSAPRTKIAPPRNATWKPSTSACDCETPVAFDVLARRECREDRQPERAADLLRGVEQTGRESLVLVDEPLVCRPRRPR